MARKLRLQYGNTPSHATSNLLGDKKFVYTGSSKPVLSDLWAYKVSKSSKGTYVNLKLVLDDRKGKANFWLSHKQGHGLVKSGDYIKLVGGTKTPAVAKNPKEVITWIDGLVARAWRNEELTNLPHDDLTKREVKPRRQRRKTKPAAATHCPHCGKPLVAPPAPDTQPETSTSIEDLF